MRLAILQDKLTKPTEILCEINLDARDSFFLECLAEHLANQAAASGAMPRRLKKALGTLHVGGRAAKSPLKRS